MTDDIPEPPVEGAVFNAYGNMVNFTDIANAVLRLRHAFLKHNLNPPASEYQEPIADVEGEATINAQLADLVRRVAALEDAAIPAHLRGLTT
jgi:hypothetical protein